MLICLVLKWKVKQFKSILIRCITIHIRITMAIRRLITRPTLSKPIRNNHILIRRHLTTIILNNNIHKAILCISKLIMVNQRILNNNNNNNKISSSTLSLFLTCRLITHLNRKQMGKLWFFIQFNWQSTFWIDFDFFSNRHPSNSNQQTGVNQNDTSFDMSKSSTNGQSLKAKVQQTQHHQHHYQQQQQAQIKTSPSNTAGSTSIKRINEDLNNVSSAPKIRKYVIDQNSTT